MILIPLRDENPVRSVPWVTGLIIAANVGAFVWQFAAGGAAIANAWGFVPADFQGGALAASTPATLLTSMFLHGGLLHLVGNLVYLWVFGNNVEDVLGAFRFAVFYLLAGLGGHALHFVTNLNSPVPAIGASGAISGVLAAYLLRFPHARVHSLLFFFFFLRWVRLPAGLVIGYWLLLQVVNGVLELGTTASSGIAWFEHIGGFAVGALLFLPFGRWRVRS